MAVGAVAAGAVAAGAVAAGADLHPPGLELGALGLVCVAPAVPVWVPALAPPAGGAAPPPVLALALEAPASANAARLGSIRWATRKISLS